MRIYYFYKTFKDIKYCSVSKEGLVIKSTGSWYIVIDDSANRFECRLRGKFKVSGLKSTNPIAVGDRVEFMPEKEDPGKGTIFNIFDRKNYIIRKATNLSRQTHILAANLDQVIVMATLAEPKTSTGFIDRLLVTCEAYSLPAVVVFNKYDLIQSSETTDELKRLMEIYSGIGYRCLYTSAANGTNIGEFADLLNKKTSLLAGHSGVGKSSLINAIEPGINLKVQDISSAHLKGKHTTTFAEMIPLSGGGYIIDTPGIKEFGLVDFKPEELCHFFPEMRDLFNRCRFDNCTHLNEPGCEVKAYVNKGKISESRYANYLNMLSGRNTRG